MPRNLRGAVIKSVRNVQEQITLEMIELLVPVSRIVQDKKSRIRQEAQRVSGATLSWLMIDEHYVPRLFKRGRRPIVYEHELMLLALILPKPELIEELSVTLEGHKPSLLSET